MGIYAREQGNKKVRAFEEALANWKHAKMQAIDNVAARAPELAATYQAVLADPDSDAADQAAMLAALDNVIEGPGGVNEKIAQLNQATRTIEARVHSKTVISTS